MSENTRDLRAAPSRVRLSGVRTPSPDSAITALSVQGFKSIANATSIEIKPLTLLAGANSSGKSSMLQPLLLLKQTLESPFDPGALRLDGPHVAFTSNRQLLSRSAKPAGRLEIGVQTQEARVTTTLLSARRGFVVERTRYESDGEDFFLSPQDSSDTIRAVSPQFGEVSDDLKSLGMGPLAATANRCFVVVGLADGDGRMIGYAAPAHGVDDAIRRVIHVPGLRGNPARNYTIGVGEGIFAGPFQNYTAAVISSWQDTKDVRLERLNEDLRSLGLTSGVAASPISDTAIELLVARTLKPYKAGRDLVSIADVGYGVSQALPVLVALNSATRNQTVLIEQPELHLHPRAQREMALVIWRAIKRRARVIVETHSSILLKAIQTLVAREQVSRADVALHWFERDTRGISQVTSASMDRAGAFGTWPQDFGDVEYDVEADYILASERQLRRGA